MHRHTDGRRQDRHCMDRCLCTVAWCPRHGRWVFAAAAGVCRCMRRTRGSLGVCGRTRCLRPHMPCIRCMHGRSACMHACMHAAADGSRITACHMQLSQITDHGLSQLRTALSRVITDHGLGGGRGLSRAITDHGSRVITYHGCMQLCMHGRLHAAPVQAELCRPDQYRTGIYIYISVYGDGIYIYIYIHI